ncbi:hypothetical protein ACFW53_20645 [Nocardiopsis dassonvillei]|uniref:hypothetical protein n=1 Tax=Nocardiopsis dassonvillei TaxID=2014 RepID=UPI00367289EE
MGFRIGDNNIISDSKIATGKDKASKDSKDSKNDFVIGDNNVIANSAIGPGATNANDKRRR